MTSSILLLTLVLTPTSLGDFQVPAHASEPVGIKVMGRDRIAKVCPLIRKSEPRLRIGRSDEARDESDDTRDVELIGPAPAWELLRHDAGAFVGSLVARSFRPLPDRSPILRC
jgi:hypothetical protein